MTETKKILIIEDNPSIRSMVESLFQTRGYIVESATNGETGLTFAQAGGFSAIILDLKMPQKDGLAFLKELQASPPNIPNGPIIIFSSASYDYARKEALRSGAAAFIAKDEVEPASLIEQVELLINQNKDNTNGQ